MIPSNVDTLTAEEREALAPYFTALEGPVFALTGLPEVVKGALFARYSRSPKSLRRLFADEFLPGGRASVPTGSAGAERAESLYEKVFVEFGDDSVAQLGGVHLAVEGASNVLTKVLERGRLMAYLEQSTRYIPYTDRPGGRWRYVTPPEIESSSLHGEFDAAMDRAFATYARFLDGMQSFFERKFPRDATTAEGAWRRAVRAKALDTVRGLLPAATKSSVGLYGSGQAFEALLLRLRASPLAEARGCADRMLVELRKVIPAFVARVDQPDRGVRWSQYLADTRAHAQATAHARLASVTPEERSEVTLADFDPDGEAKVVAAALYPHATLPDEQLLAVARSMSDAERGEILRAYVGERVNRRHKPGRAFERTSYRFDILSDYGAFRDLQRHRMLTIDWQPLSPAHGFTMPEEIAEAGFAADWSRAMDESARLFDALCGGGLGELGPYAISMAYRLRYAMQMNAREAMHVIELRTAPQGHPSYRRVCQTMHDLIAQKHPAVAAAMVFADHSAVGLERLQAEQKARRPGAAH